MPGAWRRGCRRSMRRGGKRRSLGFFQAELVEQRTHVGLERAVFYSLGDFCSGKKQEQREQAEEIGGAFDAGYLDVGCGGQGIGHGNPFFGGRMCGGWKSRPMPRGAHGRLEGRKAICYPCAPSRTWRIRRCTAGLRWRRCLCIRPIRQGRGNRRLRSAPNTVRIPHSRSGD